MDFAKEDGSAHLQVSIQGRNSRDNKKIDSLLILASMMMILSSVVVFVTETEQGSPVQEAHVVVGRMFGLLLLGLYGGLTQYSADLYIENCPHREIKTRHTKF